MEDYQYSPLSDRDGDIRLLRVEKLQDGTISCKLKSYHLGTQPDLPNSTLKYTALSYTWGDETIKVRILLNEKILHVTSNLEKALQSLAEDETLG